MSQIVDYALARRALLADYRENRIGREAICDAHPELVRAATYLGIARDGTCPICEERAMRTVGYVYGDELRRINGRVVGDDGELERLAQRYAEFTCYEVEVCLDCHWNHLVRSYVLGTAQSSATSAGVLR
ncbi:MAG: DUF5318 family protein [Actinobacteria bacterium]|nr:DUF5318 family protein [Actinomycetota bacterium]MCB9390028.1 DUF5318 family protein [Acidimicrobiia bacterium]